MGKQRKIENYGYLERMIYTLLEASGERTIPQIKRLINTDMPDTMGIVLQRMQKQGLVDVNPDTGVWRIVQRPVEAPTTEAPKNRTWVEGYLYGFRQGYNEGRDQQN